MNRLGQKVHIAGVGGEGGRNYGSIGYGVDADTLELAVGSGEVALFSWIRTGALGDEPPVEIVTVSGDGPLSNWAEIAIDASNAAGQGWLTGDGVYAFHLNSPGSLSVDIDAGTAFYSEGE